MPPITTLSAYQDDKGNEIVYAGPPITQGVNITFRGGGNTMEVAPDVKIGRLSVTFDCNNGTFRIGGHGAVPAFRATVRVGQDASVVIGDDVSATETCGMSAVEGVTIRIGDDVMIASETHFRADDGHPIFDVTTGERVNPARDIIVGDHVWVGTRAVLLGGTIVGQGSVIGWGSIVKGRIPNNCVAAGVPARVVRRDVAWERPHLSLTKPFYKPTADSVPRSRYWARTAAPDDPVEP